MVTSLAVPPKFERVAIRHHAIPAQGALDVQPSSHMHASSSARPRFIAKSYANNPFLSPNTSEMWSTDDESESSSGQDEFHLERYSQELGRAGQPVSGVAAKRGKLGSRSRKARRPDLNIVTEMPGSQVRAVGPGVVVEQVKAKKAATSRPKSVYSAKAEHVDGPSPPQRVDVLVGLKETARLRHEKNKVWSNDVGPNEFLQGHQGPTTNTSRSRDRSNQKPVVIGISIPREEVDTQRNATSDTSAITLRTPSILVTPAGGEAAWLSSPPASNRRPVSSDYSTVLPSIKGRDKHPQVPPLPQMPVAFSNFSKPHAQSDPKRVDIMHARRDSLDSWEAEEIQSENHDSKSRFSSESQERILPQEHDLARPKSEGWWNLMLSPMLSRAGTHKSTMTRKPADIPVPPLPSASERPISRSTTLDSQISPETPRRLGMAGARASTWSRWTAWEKQKDNPPTVPEEAIEKAIRQSQIHQAPDTARVMPAIIPPAKPTEGLAAEYFRACAIEQLSGETYFECENHSCAEKLPTLYSVFDREVPAQLHGDEGTVERGFVVTDVAQQRALSYSTDALSPHELSPNVRKADTVSISRPRVVGLDATGNVPELQNTRSAAVESGERAPSPAPVPVPSPPKPQARYPNIAAIVPTQHSVHGGATVASPGPISPEMQRTMTSQGAVPMSDMCDVQEDNQQHEEAPAPPPAFYNIVNYPRDETRRDVSSNVYTHNTEYKPSPQFSQMPARDEASRKEPKEEEKEAKQSPLSRLKSCASSRKSVPSSSPRSAKKRRWAILLGIALLLMIIGIVALATQLTRHGDHTPTQQQWLNLTGYPPMPTGISTIIRPDLVKQQDQCVTPSTLWSCALPKENQVEVLPNDPDQPNFRFEIKFRNGTVPSNMTIPISNSGSGSVSKRANDPFTNDLFTPNPPSPSRAEQIFLGNTTDNVTEPFDGEKTPFFMTFIPAFPVDPNDPAVNANTTTGNSDLAQRDTDLLEWRQERNLSSAIPAPSVQDDGSAAPANLLPVDPYPFAQPIRLYNRGLQDEHYGFYMFYDKSLFLGSSAPVSGDNNSSTNAKVRRQDTSGDDGNGGALRQQAKARCTFAQTRFLVRIYTNPLFPATLLNGGAGVIAGMNNRTANSATNYTPPGSFPYPTSITIDRHGGNINKKLVYCYGVDGLQVIEEDVKSVVAETRGAGGTIVNAAPGLVEFEGEDQSFDEGAGGIDGGTGGCQCAWQNWN